MCINCTFITEKLHASLFTTSKCEQTAPLFNRFNNRAKYISSMRSLSAEIWGLIIIVLKWRMAERKRISLRDHWSHFGL